MKPKKVVNLPVKQAGRVLHDSQALGTYNIGRNAEKRAKREMKNQWKGK